MRGASAIVLALALAASGCAAARSGPSPKQLEYVKAHPLSPDEERRLYAREARRGDTIDRVLVTFDDCGIERQHVEGDIAIFRVYVPIDARTIRVTTDKLEEVLPGASVLLTFERDRLKTALVLP